MLPKPMSWDRAEARAGRFDGRFLIGVLTTGIYCLPSCPARPPKPENVRLFRTEDEARAAGLRACKRCRPDLFYRGEDGDLALFEGLLARVRAAPASFPDTRALARSAGVSQSKLEDLLRFHAHLTPAAWLRRERVRAACRQLLEGSARVVDVGHAAGFESESAFHRQFLAVTRMTPGAFRALQGASVFLLQLPAGYRSREVLAWHGRDPASPGERVQGNRLLKALSFPGGGAVLEITVESDAAWCRVHRARPLDPAMMQTVHTVALRMLGLYSEVTPFETRALRDPRMAPLLQLRRGLRLPLAATGFDGLCWAILGQQINIAFASSLRRDLMALAGEKVEDMRAHPTPERVADLNPRVLQKRRYSRSKAEYLIGAATEVAEGRLAADSLGEGSAAAAERALVKVRGIGIWTARYTLMRGGGFADSAPVGDVALAKALQRLHGTDERPGMDEVETLMRPFAPYRSLATAHLWASLKDP